MSQSHQNISASKRRILADLQTSRLQLSHHLHRTAQHLTPQAIVSRSIQKHRILWITGATLAGIAIVKLVFSGKTPKNMRDTTQNSAKTSGILALLASPFLGMARKAIFQQLSSTLPDLLKNIFPKSKL
jgi:hypothetical protein